MKEYVLKDQKKMRRGITTGSCAAAAARAAATELFRGILPSCAVILTPSGDEIQVPVYRVGNWKSADSTRTSRTRDEIQMPVYRVGNPQDEEEFPGKTGETSGETGPDASGQQAGGRRRAKWYAVKDSGDDPDVTNGIRIHVEIREVRSNEIPEEAFYCEQNTHLALTGGTGVGRVTKEGLEQRIGQYAINRVPRGMIFRAVLDVCESFGEDEFYLITVSVPGGEETADKTFNKELGIVGGLSILGTSGIVEPMSVSAVVDTIELRMRMQLASGNRKLLLVPGQYGLRYASSELGLRAERAILCSNYIGDALDLAVSLGAEAVLIVGNAGKLVKLAAGIMNLHSRTADGRAEIMTAHAAMCVKSRERLTPDRARRLMEAPTTDAMLELLYGWDLAEECIAGILSSIDRHVRRRLGPEIRSGCVLFSEKYGCLGMTPGAAELLADYKEL